jgi:UDP-GlcNAc3NAcA epimerase
MKFVSVVGARPQFIKASVLSRVIRENHIEILIHTGQHYDNNMSEIFFDELGIPSPEYNLGIGSGLHGMQTGAMLAKIEQVLLTELPDWVVVYGDTNSTLAGALAASKLHIPVAHVEAGLRSFNRLMPEEINRILTDHISDRLFCPSKTALENLTREGITDGVHIVGDLMYHALLYAKENPRYRSEILKRLNLREKQYLLATVHRAENTDDLGRLRNIIEALSSIAEPVILPVHPRTRQALHKLGFDTDVGQSIMNNIKLIEPVGYLDMVHLESASRIILTDSGGVQKEAYWLRVPCITLRDETEWVETIENGWNCLVGADRDKILNTVKNCVIPEKHVDIYSENSTGEVCLKIMTNSA